MRIPVLLAAVSAVVGSPANAVFVDVKFQVQAFELTSHEWVSRYRFYARFNSDQDRVVAVQCGSAEGTHSFYQHAFGSWTEPIAALVSLAPDLALDTFVTIGLPSLSPGQPATVITPGSAFATTGPGEFHAGWSAPVDAPYTHGPSVLIAQLTFPLILTTTPTELHFVLEWIDESGQEHASCMSLAIEWDVSFPCYWPNRADINHDCVVNGIDLALLLGEWDVHVNCAPFDPRAVECPAGDMTCDGGVDGFDLAILLGEWSPVDDCQLGR